jgi:DNA-binding GntR family transcriptional regulator
MVVSDRIQSQHGTALARLRQAILSGEIAPGARMVQDDLAQRYKMSRIPLREALRTLEGEGLVVVAPHKGARCRPLEPKDLDDLYTLRLALEQLASRTASARYADLRESAAAKARVAQRLSERGDATALFYLDRDFHDELAQASGNAHVVHALSQSWSQIMRAMHYYLRTTADPQRVWDDHAAIAQAVALGDADRAQTLVTIHIDRSRDSILRGLREHEL